MHENPYLRKLSCKMPQWLQFLPTPKNISNWTMITWTKSWKTWNTLVYRIDVHARLLIFREKSPLHGLILVCTFIDFEKKFPPARLFHPARLLLFVWILWDTLEYLRIALGLLWQCFGILWDTLKMLWNTSVRYR